MRRFATAQERDLALEPAGLGRIDSSIRGRGKMTMTSTSEYRILLTVKNMKFRPDAY